MAAWLLSTAKGRHVLLPLRAAEHRACSREGAQALDKVFKEKTLQDTGAYSSSSTSGEEGRYWRYQSLCVGYKHREAQGLHERDNPNRSQRASN